MCLVTYETSQNLPTHNLNITSKELEMTRAAFTTGATVVEYHVDTTLSYLLSTGDGYLIVTVYLLIRRGKKKEVLFQNINLKYL